MRYVFFIAILFCVGSMKAQSNHIRAVKPIITDEMRYDTTGKYRVGIPPRKRENTNNNNGNTTNTGLTKTDSVRIKEKNNISDEKKAAEPK